MLPSGVKIVNLFLYFSSWNRSWWIWAFISKSNGDQSSIPAAATTNAEPCPAKVLWYLFVFRSARHGRLSTTIVWTGINWPRAGTHLQCRWQVCFKTVLWSMRKVWTSNRRLYWKWNLLTFFSTFFLFAKKKKSQLSLVFSVFQYTNLEFCFLIYFLFIF